MRIQIFSPSALAELCGIALTPWPALSNVFHVPTILVKGTERNISNRGLSLSECFQKNIAEGDWYSIDMISWEIVTPIHREYDYAADSFRLFPPSKYIDQFDVDHGDYWNKTVNHGASEDPSIPTEIPTDAHTSTPDFLNDIGKTLGELKSEHPEGEFIVNLDAYPDSASICFGKPEAEYVYYFFGTQSGDAKKAMDTYEDQLRCAGIITTASVLFPGMEDEMTFEDFFSWIGVEDYEYLGEDWFAAEGCLRFTYHSMAVWVNTNEITAGGGWDVTGAEIVKRTAPVAIVCQEILNSNQNLADLVMFD